MNDEHRWHHQGQGHDARGEPAHGQDRHGHGHTHAVGHDHVQAHGGVVGWFRGTFGHSHVAHSSVDPAFESNDRGIWALRVSLVGLGLTAVFQVIVVLLSGSVSLLADTIHNFGDAATSIPLWIAFSLAKRGTNRRLTFGYGRAEDVAGTIIVLVIFFSACVAAYEAVLKLVDPQPISHLWAVAVAALVGFVGNELVAVFRIRIGREIGSAALVADGQHSRADGFTSLAVLIGVIGAALGAPILDPLVGLAISVAILAIVKDSAISMWRRLIDAIEPEILAAAEHAPLHVPGVLDVHQVRARWLGHAVHVDLHITLNPYLSVQKAHEIVEQVEVSLASHVYSFGSAHVHVCPQSPAGASPGQGTGSQ